MFINATAAGTVITDLMTAASRAGVRRAVLLSSFTVRDNGVQPYSIGAQHKALEDAVTASGPERWGSLAGLVVPGEGVLIVACDLEPGVLM